MFGIESLIIPTLLTFILAYVRSLGQPETRVGAYLVAEASNFRVLTLDCRWCSPSLTVEKLEEIVENICRLSSNASGWSTGTKFFFNTEILTVFGHYEEFKLLLQQSDGVITPDILKAFRYFHILDGTNAAYKNMPWFRYFNFNSLSSLIELQQFLQMSFLDFLYNPRHIFELLHALTCWAVFSIGIYIQWLRHSEMRQMAQVQKETQIEATVLQLQKQVALLKRQIDNTNSELLLHKDLTSGKN